MAVPEALDRGDRPAPGLAEALAGGGGGEPAEHHAQEHGEDRAAEAGVEGQLVAQRPGQREDPLPHGHVGDHAIDQLGGEGAHAPAATGGAEAPALAREGHDRVVLTARAAQVEATVVEDAAAQVGAQLAGDEGGQPGAAVLGGGGQEAIQMGLEGPVEDRALGLAALIGGRRAGGGDAGLGCSEGAWRRRRQ